MALRDRLALLERRAAGGEMLVIIIEGGLPDEYPKTASAGELHWTQEFGEDKGAFKMRVVASAQKARATCVIIDGLPSEEVDQYGA